MRYALCIGINDYPGTGSDLSGCVNDAQDWAEELTKRGFDTEIMLDAEATGDAMRSGIRRKLAGAGSGDTVVITYSGHGTWVREMTTVTSRTAATRPCARTTSSPRARCSTTNFTRSSSNASAARGS
jgi:uncharacterized caspase-like protein